MLPAGGRSLRVRDPTSEDELFLLESELEPALAVLELARRVLAYPHGAPLELTRLPASELAALALCIRRAWLGDTIATEAACTAPGCAEPIDVSFSVSAYLEHHQPRAARGVQADAEGWHLLRGTELRFRVPLVEDLLAVHAEDRADGEPGAAAGTLLARCVAGGATLTAAHARRLDRALGALAPSLDDLVAGDCPACAATVQLRFEPCSFVLAELRAAFSPIYLETHLIAARYGWGEQAILDLPRRRRRHYARLAAEEREAA
jgi:hypothetical protein